jgi:ribosomal protein S18 acetylase RimI-like enzyme
MTDQKTYTARYAMIDDLEDIKIAYGRMLQFLEGQDMDILPTPRNVEWMVNHVFEPAIIDGRSEILIVEDESMNLASFLFWVVDADIVDTRFKKATSWGQWVDPEHRGNGLVPKMVGIARKNMVQAGVERVMDMVHTESVMQAVEDCGFKINKNIVTLEV